MENTNEISYWFLGANWNKQGDQSQRFLNEGIWANGYEDKYIDEVNSIKVGDKVVMKSSYTRKKGVPFQNNGLSVSVMKIKARGIVTLNYLDGHNIEVKWEEDYEPREWYLFTGRNTVWRITPDSPMRKNLVDFAFSDEEQDFNLFLSDPYWKNRYGERVDNRFLWASFYQAFADKLLEYRHDRSKLLEAIFKVSTAVGGINGLKDFYKDGGEGPLRDICPFTTLGIFNKGITNSNRIKIASEFSKIFGIEESVPQIFDGIPVLNNLKAWFFAYEKDRKEDDIEILWQVFETAIRLADTNDDTTKDDFINSFDDAITQYNVGWNLTCGLYWIRPWSFPTLDDRSRGYIEKKLGMTIPCNGPKKRCSGEDYLSITDQLNDLFKQSTFPVHSFPELSLNAWLDKDIDLISKMQESAKSQLQLKIENLIENGAKQIVLTGAPGTGKTHLALMIANSLGEGVPEFVQFHPSFDYTDFVEGIRPTKGKDKINFERQDGIFKSFCKKVIMENSPEKKYFFIIDEINRADLSKVFGELMYCLEESYRDQPAKTQYQNLVEEEDLFNNGFYIPQNVYIIGTMNEIDRSVEVFDFALRRRFLWFEINVEDTLPDMLPKDISGSEIIKRVTALNALISGSDGEVLGLNRHFCLGGAYFLGACENDERWGANWETRIEPLLREYVRGNQESKVNTFLSKCREAYFDKPGLLAEEATAENAD